MESSKEQNYWPAFVDALSNVVLTLVFVLVIFVFALVISSNKVEKKANEIIQAARDQKGGAAAQVIQLQDELDQTKIELQVLRAQTEQDDKNKSVNENVVKQLASNSVKIEVKPDKIVLIYPKYISELGEIALGELDKALDSVQSKLTGHTVVVQSSIGKEFYSVARRLAFYRALNIRNRIIFKKLGAGDTITSKILEPKESDYGSVEIIFGQ